MAAFRVITLTLLFIATTAMAQTQPPKLLATAALPVPADDYISLKAAPSTNAVFVVVEKNDSELAVKKFDIQTGALKGEFIANDNLKISDDGTRALARTFKEDASGNIVENKIILVNLETMASKVVFDFTQNTIEEGSAQFVSGSDRLVLFYDKELADGSYERGMMVLRPDTMAVELIFKDKNETLDTVTHEQVDDRYRKKDQSDLLRYFVRKHTIEKNGGAVIGVALFDIVTGQIFDDEQYTTDNSPLIGISYLPKIQRFLLQYDDGDGSMYLSKGISLTAERKLEKYSDTNGTYFWRGESSGLMIGNDQKWLSMHEIEGLPKDSDNFGRESDRVYPSDDFTFHEDGKTFCVEANETKDAFAIYCGQVTGDVILKTSKLVDVAGEISFHADNIVIRYELEGTQYDAVAIFDRYSGQAVFNKPLINTTFTSDHSVVGYNPTTQQLEFWELGK